MAPVVDMRILTLTVIASLGVEALSEACNDSLECFDIAADESSLLQRSDHKLTQVPGDTARQIVHDAFSPWLAVIHSNQTDPALLESAKISCSEENKECNCVLSICSGVCCGGTCWTFAPADCSDKTCEDSCILAGVTCFANCASGNLMYCPFCEDARKGCIRLC